MQKLRYFLIGLFLIGCVSVHGAGIKWYTNFDEAQKVAQKDNKPIFLLFTGHGWCPYCVKLEKEVLKKSEFADRVGSKYIFVDLDFPRNKPQSAAIAQQNDRLYKRYGIKGFPTVVVINPQGKKLAQTGYQPGWGVDGLLQRLNGSLSKAVIDFQEMTSDDAVDAQTAIEPLVNYLQEYGEQDAERWKVEMTLAQYLHSQGCDEEALVYASAGLADAPATHQPDIERFLGYLNAIG